MLDTYSKEQFPPADKTSPSFSTNVLVYTEEGKACIGYYSFYGGSWWLNTYEGWSNKYKGNFRWMYVPKELIDSVNLWKDER